MHDLGRGFGSTAWTTYPAVVPSRPSEVPVPPSASGNPASVSDNLGGTVDAEFSMDSAAAEALALPLGDLASDLAVGALNARKSRRILEGLKALVELPVEQRLQAASLAYVSLELEQVANKASTDSHWILTGVHPRARIYVAAHKRDSAYVGEMLALLIG